MKLFRRKWSKWTPITIYTFSYSDFILLAKINLDNGDLRFKSIKVHGRFAYTQAYHLFNKPFDANTQLMELLSLTTNK